MNSLYTLIHTAVVFFLGSASIVATNANLSFGVDVVLMGITAHHPLQLDLPKDQAQCAVCAVGGHGADFLFQQHPDNPYPGDGPQRV